MGFIEETVFDELGIESRRTSYRIWDENVTSQQIFAHDNINGCVNDSVEIGASQLLRIIKFFEIPENRKKLEEKIAAEIREMNRSQM